MIFDDRLTTRVKELALACGLARVGVAPAGPIEQADVFRAWLAAGYHADMNYLAENVETRLHPGKIIDNAQAVICLAASYRPVGDEPDTDAFLARYARGRDYHKVLKKRAHDLCDRIRDIAPEFVGRTFVDTAPLPERSLAVAAGLGWIGRNGLLIIPGLGSYVLLAEIVCNLPLRPDPPRPNGCGDCSKCVSACPTGAIVAEHTVDARRCLSYQTIENRGDIPPELWPAMGSCVFGCDACQAVCPHNRRNHPGDPALTAPPNDAPPTLAEILTWSHADWDRVTQGRSLRRATHRMFLRNAILAAGNAGRAELLPPLEALSAEASLKPYVAWAKAQILATRGE